MIDERVGTAELVQLAQTIETPYFLGDYVLEGLIRKTSTALLYVARGGVFGADDGAIKLTGREYAPLLERELGLLNWCQDAEVSGVVRPVRPELEWIAFEAIPCGWVAALLMPFLAGGDMVQWIGAHATRTGHLGPHLALDVGEQVGTVMRDLLQLPKPLVHRDVKLQNVLLPYPGAPLAEMTLIDFDVSEQLDIPLHEFATAPREIAEWLVEDVHGFGEMLFSLATGREPPVEGLPDPVTGNTAFDALVTTCLTSEADGGGYVCLADTGLWRDLETARAMEQTRPHKAIERWGASPLRDLLERRSLAGIGLLLFLGLLLAVAWKVCVG